jgi:hypothetical protein
MDSEAMTHRAVPIRSRGTATPPGITVPTEIEK